MAFNCRAASAAMVSKTMLDLTEPETPANTVIFSFGIVREMFFRLFSVTPLMIMSVMMTLPFRGVCPHKAIITGALRPFMIIIAKPEGPPACPVV